MTRAFLSASLQAAGGSTLVLVASSHRQAAQADPRRGRTHGEAHPNGGREICTGVKRTPSPETARDPTGPLVPDRGWAGRDGQTASTGRADGADMSCQQTNPAEITRTGSTMASSSESLNLFEGGGRLEAV
jgi:hypothetical protein